MRIRRSDGSTVEGRWVLQGGDVEAWVVQDVRGSPHGVVLGEDQVDILARVQRPRRRLLDEDEAKTVAELLDELSGVYAGEDLGRLAGELAAMISDRLGL